MNTFRHYVAALLATLVSASLGQPLLAQSGAANGVSREAMWPAPTAEDWQRPCLITWQRNFDDARAVSLASGKPIMVAVNMDGEIASEHYAGIRYRQPEIAALYEPYVNVIASVYRHTPRDYDENGRRVLCPRFGSVTCGEHIDIEPGLHDRYFEGTRVAPRHIGLELDSEEMYDVFYAFDTDSVFAAIRDGIANRPAPPEAEPQGDRPLVERVQSQDIDDRTAVEQAYQEGDQALRQALLNAAMAGQGEAPVELLRLALSGYDTQLSRSARTALQRATSPGAISLIVEALGGPLSTVERKALIGALQRIGETSPRARRLAVVHGGLSEGSGAVDALGWSDKLDTPAAQYRQTVAARLALAETEHALLVQQDDVLSSDDGTAHLDLAEAFLAQAFEQPLHEQESRSLLLQDARNTAAQARELGATGWRADTVSAVAAYYLEDTAAAWRWSGAAMSAGVPDDASDWNSMVVLAVFAQSRQEAIRKALREQEEWPGQWLADVHAACSILALHPHGTDTQIVAHYEFLDAMGADGQAEQILQTGLGRFPDSPALHAKYRGRLMARKGIDALEAAYHTWLTGSDSGESAAWYAGFASSVAAEFHRRAGRKSAAVAAYSRAMELYEQDISDHPDSRLAADTEIALALAGQARVSLEQGQLRQATALLLSSFDRQPDAAANLDGLNLSPADTAKILRAQLADADLPDVSAVLQQALDQLDPKLLRLPSYEFPSREQNRQRPWRLGAGPSQTR
ncbi:MAG: hypothetical protein ACI9EF_003788 [Pseudohongiellaceae bacterium]|jgi:hypothetical protein